MKIEDFLTKKTERIGKIIMGKKEEYPYIFREDDNKKKGIIKSIISGYNESKETRKIEKEIYERALQEANAFFVKNTEAKFDKEILKYLKSRLDIRLKNPKVVKNLEPEIMLANVLKIDVLDYLLENDVVILY